MTLPKDYKTLNVFFSDIETNRYKLHIKTVEYYWNNGGLKSEDMPGNFLDVEVKLIGITLLKPSALELLAVEKQVVLYETTKEITNEPQGYAKLWHDHMTKRVKEQPNVFLQNLADAVKKAL